MLLATSLVAVAAEATAEIPPIAVGGGILVILVLMLLGLLAFGRGREHS